MYRKFDVTGNLFSAQFFFFFELNTAINGVQLFKIMFAAVSVRHLPIPVEVLM
jgi:hypothetical protein